MAKERKIGSVTVNDGKGLMDNEGLIDSLIVDVNDQVKQLLNGQYIGFCSKAVTIVQKLANLRNGIVAEKNEYKNQIEYLHRQNDELAEKLYGVPVERTNEKTAVLKKDGAE